MLRGTGALAWSIWMVAVALTAAGLVLTLQNADSFAQTVVAISAVVPPLTVGAIVAARRSEHPIGWMLLLMGMLWAIVGSTSAYARFALVSRPGAFPAGVAVGWLASWSFALPLAVLALLVLLFPTGRLPSARWRPVVCVVAIDVFIHVLLTALAPGSLSLGAELLPVDNPLGFEPAGLVGSWFWFWPFVLMLPPIAAVAWRFRGARAVEREQLKWLVYAATVVPVLAPISFNFDVVGATLPTALNYALGFLLWGVTVSGVPVAIGIAVLRYRLYEIDLIIRRTLIYGFLTLGLALIYWGAVVLLQQVLRPFTAGSDFAIVASTLAVAASFQPFRRRIQLVVDRRFYRQRYDSARTLESFSSRLREDIDLNRLQSELLGVVRQTMQPTHASVWLRRAE